MTRITVKAESLRCGDWIEGEGEVLTFALTLDGHVFVRVPDGPRLFRRDELLIVRLD